MVKSGLFSLMIVGAVAFTGHTASAAGDAEAGARVFRQCKACHTLEAGKHRVGPSLQGVFGRISGTAEGFRYSGAMRDAAIVWDDETIAAYLERPRQYLPRNRMAFAGLRKEQDRLDVIAYLHEAQTAE